MRPGIHCRGRGAVVVLRSGEKSTRLREARCDCGSLSELVLLRVDLAGAALIVSGAGEVELWNKAARCIGALADEQPGESPGSYKVDMVPKHPRTRGEKVEKVDTTITGGRPMSGARQKCMAKDWSSGPLQDRQH
ncbi:hypothetical protein NDU88_000530 [Pleurodeles waltl]|uniref:Uncharacterized protein n=1 Tax=Pleurodeles waltl TaxID=8319 RepID=A0AAV7S7F8_PLEWA|nr:hypothetical protein NDU88_000530 [Pleurodeles waltl]